MNCRAYIDGIGLLSPAACSVAELLALAKRWKGGEEPTDFTQKVEFDVGVPAAKVRRAPRYVKMTVAAASLAWKDGGLPDEEREAAGTVFLTSYGSLESNIAFTETVLDGVPSLASPTQFSYTVPNSCLGQTCIAHGFRGPSTMLLGGDPLEYSALLMAEGKARHIVCGAVDERNEDLRTSMEAAGQIVGENLADGAVMLLLSAEKSDKTYCGATAFASAGLPICPYVDAANAEEREEILSGMTEALRELCLATPPTHTDVLVRTQAQDAPLLRPPDLVLTAGNGSSFDALEERALSEAFGEKVPRLAAKRFFGEAFAVGYLENVALGAVLLKNEGERGIRSLVATGVDAHGNYLALRLEA